MTLLRALAAAIAAASIVTACAPTDDGQMVVLTASSLVDVTADLADAWGRREVLISDAGSQVLDAQLRGGADADVVLLAEPDIAHELTGDGLTDEAAVVATNDLAIAVAPDRADRIAGLGDLVQPGLRLVLADEGVPLGDRTREGIALAVEGGLLPSAAAVLDNVVSFEDAARVVLAKVSSREVDAAIVYATDARAAGTRVTTVAWPAAATVDISYTIQVVEGARPGAREFREYALSSEAAEIWQRHGFRPVASTTGP